MNIKLYFSIMCLISTFSIFSMSHEELPVRIDLARMKHQAALEEYIRIQQSPEGLRRIQEYQQEYGSYLGKEGRKTIFPKEFEAEKAAHKEFMDAYHAYPTPEASSNRG